MCSPLLALATGVQTSWLVRMADGISWRSKMERKYQASASSQRTRSNGTRRPTALRQSGSSTTLTVPYGYAARPAQYQTSSRSDWWIRYSEYLKSPEWKAKRKRLYRDRGGRCEDCGKKLKSHYHAHHKTYERVGNEDLDDLELLCTKCHEKRHPGKKLTRRKRARKSSLSLLLLALAALSTLLLLSTLA